MTSLVCIVMELEGVRTTSQLSGDGVSGGG